MDQSEGPMNLGNLKNNLWDWYESTPGLSMFKTCRLKNWISFVIEILEYREKNLDFSNLELSWGQFYKYKSHELWELDNLNNF